MIFQHGLGSALAVLAEVLLEVTGVDVFNWLVLLGDAWVLCVHVVSLLSVSMYRASSPHIVSL